MSRRRKVSSDISASLTEYVLARSGLTQEQFAETLEVSPAFISRVRTRERSFTIDHLQAIQQIMGVPLGALLIAAVPLPEPRPETKRLRELALAALAAGDQATEALKKRSQPAAK
jgi:transcriptional regulator with XRE-family HTH domain